MIHPLRVLIACEESGTMRLAAAATAGHIATKALANVAETAMQVEAMEAG